MFEIRKKHLGILQYDSMTLVLKRNGCYPKEKLLAVLKCFSSDFFRAKKHDEKRVKQAYSCKVKHQTQTMKFGACLMEMNLEVQNGEI